MSRGCFIDPPSPFSPLSEWETFAADMRRIADTNPDAKAELERAERHIADSRR